MKFQDILGEMFMRIEVSNQYTFNGEQKLRR